jgi:hypothetical protein
MIRDDAKAILAAVSTPEEPQVEDEAENFC